MTREAAADTRGRKTGHAASPISGTAGRPKQASWAGRLTRLIDGLTVPAQEHQAAVPVTVEQVLDHLSTVGSTWTRADVLRAVCDLAPPVPGCPGAQWAAALNRSPTEVLAAVRRTSTPTVPADPAGVGWSFGVARAHQSRTTPSPAILAEEERILTWAMDAQARRTDTIDHRRSRRARCPPGRRRRGRGRGRSARGRGRPGGDGQDHHAAGRCGRSPPSRSHRVRSGTDGQGRPCPGRRDRHGRPTPSPSSSTNGTEATGSPTAATSSRPARPWSSTRPGCSAPAPCTSSIRLADQQRLASRARRRPPPAQAVGRGGLFDELCATSRAHELVRIHRFTHPWEAAASLQLRAGEPDALGAYESHGRITAGTLDDHLATIAAGLARPHRRRTHRRSHGQ